MATAARKESLSVAVSGASGLVGSNLLSWLNARGHHANAVSRRGSAFDVGAIQNAQVVVNLAGAGLADSRWTAARKQELVESRVGYTRRLIAAAKQASAPVKVWVQASAIGVYGNRGSEILNESARIDRGKADFLSQLCLDWEAAGEEAATLGARVVTLRLGIVQSAAGGALKKMLPLFKLGLGGPLAGGANWQSWVALDDLLAIISFVIEQERLTGPFNAVAPYPVTSAQYARTLGHVLHRPALIPTPGFALRGLFGEMADVAILASQRVRPERLLEAGYKFLYPTLEEALKHTL